MIDGATSPVGLPPVRIPGGAIGRPVVLVSARGLWDRYALPGSPDALVRAFQRTVPCLVSLGEAGSGAGLDLEEVRGVLDRCHALGPPRIEVPFLIETSAPDTVAAALEPQLERFPGCRVIRRGPHPAAKDGLFPVVSVRTSRDEPDGVWAWRVPIETLLDRELCPGLVERLVERGARRVVLDSVDVLTDVDQARAWPPSRDEELLDRIASRLPGIDFWRVTDLLEGAFLAYGNALPLG